MTQSSRSSLVAIAVILCAAVPASAASINWSAVQKITADADVSLNGTLVRAINATPTNTTLAVDVTLNGVTFVAARKNGSGLYVAPGGDTFQPSDTGSVGPTSGGFQAFGQGGAPFSTLSPAYSNLLCTAYWNDGTDIGNTWFATAAYDWTLNNLTVGRTYELQVWVNDSRLSNLGQNNPGLYTTVMDTNGHSVNLEHNVDNLLGGVGQHVVGTFSADAASQALKLVGGNTVGADLSGSTATSLLNAYQLRDITPGGVPRFTSTKATSTGMVFNGTNGPANGGYEMLRATDLRQPLAGWQSMGTGMFDAGGGFNFTNTFGGSAATFYRLRVLSSVPVFAPTITSQPQDETVAAGQSVTFTVTATGTAPLGYQWLYNTNTILSGQTNAALTLTNVQPANAGSYSVTVTNLYGAAGSSFARLALSTNLNSVPVGWATVSGSGLATTTGGGNATPILATDITQLRSLAGDAAPRVILLSGTYITGATPLEIASHKTLRGVNSAVLIQGGININTCSNIIVQNISIQANGFGGTPVDAAAARTSHHLWFDHVTFSDAGDGLLDLTIGSDFITVSWCKFFYTDPNNTHRLCSLVGNGSTAGATDTGKNNVTYHHNWFAALVDQRMPRLLFGKGHMFNNYYNSPGNGYCIGTGSWGSGLVENNYFQQVKNPHQSQDGNPSYIVASGNIYDNTTGNTHTGLLNPLNDGNDPGPWTPSYSYTLDAAASVPSIVTQGAGPQ
ncbi:MAG: immunoglobulin domain-containing protein [Verrucomicrobiota bacterium]